MIEHGWSSEMLVGLQRDADIQAEFVPGTVCVSPDVVEAKGYTDKVEEYDSLIL